jgi:hypothetical protein
MDPVSERLPKLVVMDKQADDEIVHTLRLGWAAAAKRNPTVRAPQGEKARGSELSREELLTAKFRATGTL